jgi:hypothetical protein
LIESIDKTFTCVKPLEKPIAWGDGDNEIMWKTIMVEMVNNVGILEREDVERRNLMMGYTPYL